MQKIKGRTDLAVELGEDVGKERELNLEGIQMETRIDAGIKETKIIVENALGEKLLGKPVGSYITIEGEDLTEEDEDYHRAMSRVLCNQMKKLLEGKQRILVAGLGNRGITPDALGPLVTEKLYITRHLLKEKLIREKKSVSAIIPGVMAQTGMETNELIQSIVKETGPDIVVVVDALAARNANRLNRTIQISDTGIVPGSGVGNHRNAITEETVGVPVLAIGVPTVISVPAILYSAMEQMRESSFGRKSEWSEEEVRQFTYEICSKQLAEMFVTPKNVDESIKRMSDIISEAINAYIMETGIYLS